MNSLNPTKAARGDAERGAPVDPFDRFAWPAFAVAAVIATGLVLWFGRGGTYSADELIWFMQTPNLDLGGALEPHIGHLILSTRVVYKAIYSIFGVGYLPFRLLTMGTVVLAAGLFFAYAGRRVGKRVALAPTLILLIFGSDGGHLLTGNGFTVVGAIACGLGALLALDRDDRTGDLIACSLLCLGVVTYTIALAFVVGIAVSILLRADRWRRIWIVVVPVAIYAAWWVWALGSGSSSENQLSVADVLLFPSWSFQSLSAALSALSGFDYPYGDTAGTAGPALALLALAALGWRISRPPVPRMLWAVLAVPPTLWLMGAVSSSVVRAPDSDRYLYPAVVAILVLAAWSASGVLWGRRALIALFGFAAIGLATNVALARDNGAGFRNEAPAVRAALAGIEIAGPNANPDYVPADAPGPVRFSIGPTVPAGAYLEATDSYGDVGYSPDELRAADETLQAGADATLAGALGLVLGPSTTAGGGADCVELGPEPAQQPSVELAPGQAVRLSSDRPAAVQVRRFAADSGVPVGTLTPGQAAELAVPADQLPEPWQVTSDEPARACVSG